jgi:hypothetical protein
MQLMARRLLPVLEAQLRRARRWCAGCHRMTPDRDLPMCSGCNEVAYCGEVCQQRHWEEHKGEKECRGMKKAKKERKKTERLDKWTKVRLRAQRNA